MKFYGHSTPRSTLAAVLSAAQDDRHPEPADADSGYPTENENLDDMSRLDLQDFIADCDDSDPRKRYAQLRLDVIGYRRGGLIANAQSLERQMDVIYKEIVKAGLGW